MVLEKWVISDDHKMYYCRPFALSEEVPKSQKPKRPKGRGCSREQKQEQPVQHRHTSTSMGVSSGSGSVTAKKVADPDKEIFPTSRGLVSRPVRFA